MLELIISKMSEVCFIGDIFRYLRAITSEFGFAVPLGILFREGLNIGLHGVFLAHFAQFLPLVPFVSVHHLEPAGSLCGIGPHRGLLEQSVELEFCLVVDGLIARYIRVCLQSGGRFLM